MSSFQILKGFFDTNKGVGVTLGNAVLEMLRNVQFFSHEMWGLALVLKDANGLTLYAADVQPIYATSAGPPLNSFLMCSQCAGAPSLCLQEYTILRPLNV